MTIQGSDNCLKKRLLIVEDEVDLREVLVELLESSQFDVVTAPNGKEALALLIKNEGPVDAILSDAKMPVMDGLTLLFELRERGFETPFILLTGNVEKTAMITALRLRILDFLEKPFDPRELVSRVEVALELGYRNRLFKERVDQLARVGDLSLEFIEKLNEAYKAALPPREN